MAPFTTNKNRSDEWACKATRGARVKIELVDESRKGWDDGTFEMDYNKVAGELLGDDVAAVRAGRR